MSFEDFANEPSRTALPAEMAGEIERRFFSPECVKITLVRHQGIGPRRTSMKPVRLRGQLAWQTETTDGKKVFVKNHETESEARSALSSLLNESGAREYHFVAAGGDLHVRVTRKGRPLVSRGKASGEAVVREHDHGKDQPLGRFDSAALLRALGMTDGNGRLKASMAAKADQVNSFLREVDSVLDSQNRSKGDELRIVDCGCGRAYLTLSAYAYLSQHWGFNVKVLGIDRNAELMAKSNALASDLGAAGFAEFRAADLKDASVDFVPDLVLSLHACDIATDLAIARGIEWKARAMLIAPCCQHDLQEQLGTNGDMRALMRHSILKERLADLLTDAFRAQMLRVKGYRVRVIEFVSHESTPRNIMLRAEYGVKPGMAEAIDDYEAMRDYWKVTPAIERIVGPVTR